MNEQLYCDVAECDDGTGHPRPVFRYGKCQSHAKQLQRTGKTSPITEQLSIEERVISAGSSMLEAEDDHEYQEKRRLFLVACKALGRKEQQRAMREGYQRALRKGLVGRPRKVEAEAVHQLFKRLKDTTKVASALNISERTVRRCLQILSTRHRGRSRVQGAQRRLDVAG